MPSEHLRIRRVYTLWTNGTYIARYWNNDMLCCCLLTRLSMGLLSELPTDHTTPALAMLMPFWCTLPNDRYRLNIWMNLAQWLWPRKMPAAIVRRRTLFKSKFCVVTKTLDISNSKWETARDHMFLWFRMRRSWICQLKRISKHMKTSSWKEEQMNFSLYFSFLFCYYVIMIPVFFFDVVISVKTYHATNQLLVSFWLSAQNGYHRSGSWADTVERRNECFFLSNIIELGTKSVIEVDLSKNALSIKNKMNKQCSEISVALSRGNAYRIAFELSNRNPEIAVCDQWRALIALPFLSSIDCFDYLSMNSMIMTCSLSSFVNMWCMMAVIEL